MKLLSYFFNCLMCTVVSCSVHVYLVHFLSCFSAQVCQCEVCDDLTVVAAAHVHDQESILFKGIDLMQCEHGLCTVLHGTLLLYQSQNGLIMKCLMGMLGNEVGKLKGIMSEEKVSVTSYNQIKKRRAMCEEISFKFSPVVRV